MTLKPNEADFPVKCPLCSSNLLGDPIPEDQKEHFAGNYFKREIGLEYPEKYDGVWSWKCPDCEGTWPSAVGALEESVLVLTNTARSSKWEDKCQKDQMF